MAAYRRFYDSRHLQAGYQEPQEPESAPRDPTLGIRVWATFTLFLQTAKHQAAVRAEAPSTKRRYGFQHVRQFASLSRTKSSVLSCLVFNRPRRPECCLLQAILICVNNSSDGRVTG